MDNVGITSVFVALLLVAAILDARTRRVPNWLVVAVLIVGLTAAATRVSVAGTISSAALGVTAGLLVWLPFWLLGLLGAGDVKFFAAASSWLGPALSLRASVGVALVGGIVALGFLVARLGLKRTTEFGLFSLANSRAVIRGADVAKADVASRTFPYAVPMALVVGLAMFYPKLF